jgi:hypothetical protein
MRQRAAWREVWMVTLASLLLAACGNDGDDGSSGSATATRTPTRTVTASPPPVTPSETVTATPQPTPAAVRGLVVADAAVAARGNDQLGTLPAQWSGPPVQPAFDRALSHADWIVLTGDGVNGATGEDGQFEITGLSPGRHLLELRVALGGNLASVVTPFAVGDDGSAQVVVELTWGLARTTSVYVTGGVSLKRVDGPYGGWVILGDGQIRELGDGGRRLVDSDGDGHFETSSCTLQAWSCDEQRSCGDARVCACTASCPDCEDCGPGVCVPLGQPTPYRCDAEGACANPGDRCICVSSCEACDDCVRGVCVPGCDPVEIAGISIVGGPTRIVVGEQGALTATARLTDGGRIDVTHLATWRSSDESVAVVDAWGTVVAKSVGEVSITAALGGFASQEWPLSVVARPPLRRIHVQNLSCLYPLARPPYVDPATMIDPPVRGDILPVPTCHQVVQVGATRQFMALGEFDGGYYEDITNEVHWRLEPPEVGRVDGGVFTALQAGTTRLTAMLQGVVSEPTEIRVVTEPTVVALSIYPSEWSFVAVDGGPVRDGLADPCFECRAAMTVLRGDQVRFRATALYDTGFWEDVTEKVTWRSSDPVVAPIGAMGQMTAAQAGEATIDATFEGLTSNPIDVRVVNAATLLSLSIYQEGTDRVLAVGEERYFRATGFYDLGFWRDLTAEVTWRSSAETIGRFATPGVFTGSAPGTTEISAELGDQRSQAISLEVYEAGDLEYCDPTQVNRGHWSDSFNRVTLESDCGIYRQPDVVALRYTVTETQPHGVIFDPCLDLYVYRGRERVRTIREEGCGDPFVAAGAPSRDAEVLKYQLRAFWDLKTDSGLPVPPGRYTIYGRFYLYYDPVVSIDVIVEDGGGRIPCEENTCGNGCGYVHACGNTERPLVCPAVCTQLCECAPGWGITSAGDCEPCLDECCPVGAACPPGVERCEIACCPPNARCTAGIPPCQPGCCSLGAFCPLGLPPCGPECCPFGALCGPLNLPPCPPSTACCAPGEACIPELPPCLPVPF